ncbi:hypothetical protein ABFP36_23130 [Salmonella enterica subsp. enterica serovar Kentucky]
MQRLAGQVDRLSRLLIANKR